jgi:periplasmic protein TonB
MKIYFNLLWFVVFNSFAQNTITATSDISEDQEMAAGVPMAVIEQVPIFVECKSLPLDKHRTCFEEMMYKFVSKNFYYPDDALEKKIQGRVIVRFVIEKDGSIVEVEARGAHPILEEAALNMFKKMPKLIPGTQRGKAVRVLYTIPLTFKLE